MENEPKLNSDYLESIAKVCHQANKAFCETHGDNSQPNWEDAPEWQRESAINGVTFRINNPTAGNDAMHNNWMKEKVEDGWVYGDVKDPEKKTHPCIVAYNELPMHQKQKDSIFSAVVDSLTKEHYNVPEGLTFGQKAVGLTFNPSANDAVAQTKQQFADVIDNMNQLRNVTSSGEVKRMCSVAITDAQSAQMWAVKAITWKD